MARRIPLRTRFRAFWRREDGAATAFSLYIIITGLLVGSYAIDASNVMSERTRLQIAADNSAHDALVYREFHSEGASKNVAVARSQVNMPPSVFGHPLNEDNVVFGTWDTTTRKFTAQPGSTSAVQVTMFRDKNFGNSVATYLMGLVGVNHFNVAARSVFQVYYPACLNQGFVAQGVVDVQSNNNYMNNFCVHSQQYVKVSTSNNFESGVVVSMPDTNNLQLPASGFTTNPGLQSALQDQSYNIRILNQLPGIIAGLTDPSSQYFQPYITNPTPIVTTAHSLKTSDLVPGNIYMWDCHNNSQIQALSTVKDVVIIANCEMNIGQGVSMENSILANTNTSDTAISAPYGFSLGAQDNCAPGGGSQILSLGGFNDAAGMTISGSQIITRGPLAFTALANGIQGASLISGSTISGTSLMNFANCPPTGMNEFRAEYFRMVQ